MKAIYKNLLLMLFGLIVAILIFEIFVRMLIAGENKSIQCMYAADKELGYINAANFTNEFISAGGEFKMLVKTNSRGERGPNVPIGENDFIILGLGDSFAFGQGVDFNETFFEIIENKLQENYPGKNARVLNFGVGGYNNKQELLMAKRLSSEMSPKLVIVGVFIGNDIYGNAENFLNYDVQNYCLVSNQSQTSRKKYFKELIGENFKSYAFISQKIRMIPVLREFLISIGLMGEKRMPPYVETLKNPPAKTIESGWIETDKTIREFADFAEQNSAKTVFVLIPSAYQVYGGKLKKEFELYGVNPAGYEIDYPEKRIKNELEGKKNVVVIDLLPEFRENSGKKLYYENDPHWNAEGNRLAAEIIFKKLADEKLLEN